MTGGCGVDGPVTVIERRLKSGLLPPRFLAVTVYVVAEVTVVGVPVMSPVDGFNTKPAGRLGKMAYDVATPPDMVGKLVVIATFTA